MSLGLNKSVVDPNLYYYSVGDTTTYCKNSDVLFAALWTKLSILSQNSGNSKKKKKSCCPITSLLPR
jgi:hypothetical protein